MEIKLKHTLLLALPLALLMAACGESKKPEQPAVNNAPAPEPVPMMDFTLVRTLPHDETAFTEGLLFDDGKLLESTGAPDYLPQARSALGVVDTATGKLQIKAELDKRIYFGEGMVVLNGKIFQVTYQNQQGFVYDAKTYKQIATFNYPNKEGWGLTTDGTYIIMSDGTYNLTYIDPVSYQVVKTLAVTESGFATELINELEYINGFIYANLWTKNMLVKIDPKDGTVKGKLDLSSLYNKERGGNINLLEMNGIAWDKKTDRILVTGKFWKNFYQISFPH